MKKRKPGRSMGIAECARRTGLTVRALRVYERLGLIKPSRSASRYRIYNRTDLVRLNAIVALKSLGLSLEQIREVLSGPSPKLKQVLHMQLEVWEARRATADKGLRLVRKVLAGLGARARLSISDLCDLVRSMDMSNLKEITREAINESMSPDEERAWATWWTNRPAGEDVTMQQYAVAQRAVMVELAKLQAAGEEPTSTGVQNLILQWVSNLSRYGVREMLLEAMDWNTALTRKLFRVGERITTKAVASQVNLNGGDVWKFLRLAWKAGPAGRALEALLDEVRPLTKTSAIPTTPQGASFARRLERLCQQHQLGDPVVYARWSCGMGTFSDTTGEQVDLNPTDQAAWSYLIEAGRAAGLSSK